MEASASFGTEQLFITDSRLVLAMLNHLRYQALNRVFGVSRSQANVLTVVVLASAANGTYEAARRIRGRLRVSGDDAAIGAFVLRSGALAIAGPSVREVPGAGTLLALGIIGGLAAPSLRRTAERMRAGEQRLRGAEERLRRERISRYVAARSRGRASAP